MLLILILLLYTFLVTHLVGIKMYIIIQKWFKVYPIHLPQQGLSNLIGMATMAPFIAWFHFFSGIGYIIHFFFLALALSNKNATALILRNVLDDFKKNPYPYIILFVAATVAITVRPGHGDIADYHLQAIRWAEAYRNIPGLGNFNRPLSNNNWWFNLQAFFGCRFLGVQSVYVGNALFFVCVALFMLNQKQLKTNWFVWLQLGFVLLCLKAAFVGAVTPDFIITCLLFVCAILFDEYFIQQNRQEGLLIALFILACFAVTIKLNAIALAIPAVLALWELTRPNRLSSVWKPVLIAAVFFVPWIIGNIVASGWLVYPLDGVDLFNVDWKVPKATLQFERFSIIQWGKNPGGDIYITAAMRPWEWLPRWFAFHDMFNKVLIILSALSLVFLAFTKRTYSSRAYVALFIFMVAGLFFCLSNGPHIRYTFGYMILLIAVAARFAGNRFRIEPKECLTRILRCVIVVITLAQLALFVIKVQPKAALLSILYPQPYPQLPLPVITRNNNKLIITQQEGTCWDQFPCSYYMVKGCEMRGKDFVDGFRVK